MRKKKKVEVIEEKKPERNIIKLGNQEFVICPKCGWQHNVEDTKCRFCGSKM